MANHADPFILASQARMVLQSLHEQSDVVVRLKTDESDFEQDFLTDEDREHEGHFQFGKNELTINLDATSNGKDVTSLATIDDWRQHPILAGVGAHEAGHAKWTQWNDVDNPDAWPDRLENPDYDPDHPAAFVKTTTPNPNFESSLPADRITNPEFIEEEKRDPDYRGPEFFPVSGNGKLLEYASLLDEPRIERLGANNFPRLWRRAMEYSAGHLVVKEQDEREEAGENKNPVDAAAAMAILVGGRVTAGTLGTTAKARENIRGILDQARAIIEQHNDMLDPEVQTKNPYETVMKIVNTMVFSNEHSNPVPILDAARRIISILHPEQKDDPDSNDGSGDGASALSPEQQAALAAAAQEMKEGMDDAAADMAPEQIVDEDQPASDKAQESGGHGAVRYRNQLVPAINHHEAPNDKDRELYRKAREWMFNRIEPSVTTTEIGTWLPGGGARLDVRRWIKDNLFGNVGPQRSDWLRVSETTKPQPPVKVGIMLDGSGSMSSYARQSASIAWAASNAAADLPESRTVSVIYGSGAGVTQEPGRAPARDLAVSNTDGPWENFIEAAELVDEHLWTGDEMEEGVSPNTLIIIVSDLQYGATGQMKGFSDKVQEWSEKGFTIMVIGANPGSVTRRYNDYGDLLPLKEQMDKKVFELVQPGRLFEE